MKNITIIKTFVIVLLGALGISSCQKEFLDRPPLGNLTAGTFFTTDAELLAGTGALYNIVWFGYNGQSMEAFGDARGGNFITPYVADWYQFATFSVSPTNGALRDSWSSFYNVIAQSNVLMYNVTNYTKSGVSETAKKTALGEARFMRALAYTYLVQNWGPVPIITDNLTQGSDTTLQRNTVESVWQFAIRDMYYAAANLPATPALPGRLTKYSAEGMLARFYLTRAGLGSSGGTRNQTYLDSAKYFAKDVIMSGKYNLMENYPDLFLTKNNNNPEQLFGLLWVPIRDPWGVGNGFQSQFAANSQITGGTDGWGGGHGATFDYLTNLDPADSIRRKATYMLALDHYPELNKKQGGWTEPYDPNSWTDIAHFKKYIVGTPDDNDGKGQVQATGNNTYMQRLADVYLIYAEAVLGNNASTSDAEALKYYNAIRTRAGLPAVTSFTFDNLLHERRYEFAVEGDAWYDLVRLYYYNPTKALAYINAQNKNKGDYTVRIKAGTGTASKPRVFIFTKGNRDNPGINTRDIAPVTDANMFLPYPDTELSIAPNLRKPPVPYKF
jgi:hypothetical protein